MGWLSDLVFGRKPKTETTFRDVGRTTDVFNELRPLIEDSLQGAGKNFLSGIGAMGPGMQGTVGSGVASSMAPFLMQLLGMSERISDPIITQTAGSEGLLSKFVGGLGSSIGLGATGGLGGLGSLFGGGGFKSFVGSSMGPLEQLDQEDRGGF